MADTMPPPPDKSEHPKPKRTGLVVLAEALRAEGDDELAIAETMVATEVDVAQWVREGRAKDPRTYPGYIGDPDAAGVARRVLGVLLEIGWTPPEAAR